MMHITLADVLEKERTSQVVEPPRTLGWLRFHAWNSKHSPSGYPDETLVRERVVWLELKTERGRLSSAQKEWLRALMYAGAEVYLIRPRHLDALCVLLSHRGVP